MTREEIIQGLQFTIDMFLLNPTTGETYTEPINDMDKTTIDACKGAIKLLKEESEKDEVILTKKEYGELVSSEFDNGYAKGFREALEQEPCEDAISRQAVLEQTYLWSKGEFLRVAKPFDYLRKRINSLPSVTPKPKTDILDKIRAEIDSYCSDNRDRNDGLYIAMQIIDKYKAESEVD